MRYSHFVAVLLIPTASGLKLALCYAFLVGSLAGTCKRKQICGKYLFLLPRYILCNPKTQREVCTMFFRRRLRQGYICGPCETSLECPPVGTVKEITDYRETTTLELSTSEDDVLCTLRLVSKTGSMMLPIARSYLGHDWEPYAGGHAGLEFTCSNSACSTIIPGFSKSSELINDGYTYQLASFRHSTDHKDQVARFLEQGTFGPTRAELRFFPGSFSNWVLPESFANWVELQQTLAMTSHRRFFRERLNHRFEIPSYQGVSTLACAQGTRYRKYAFSDKDFRRYVEVRTDEATGRKTFFLDRQARTVVNVTSLYAGSPENNKVYEDGL
jgi:hypothetical protein